jgi:hypothetical protein
LATRNKIKNSRDETDLAVYDPIYLFYKQVNTVLREHTAAGSKNQK